MGMWQFLIIVALLVWIIRRLPTPWVYEMQSRWIVELLHRAEARARGIPVEEVEKEYSEFIADGTADHDGTPLLRRMWR